MSRRGEVRLRAFMSHIRNATPGGALNAYIASTIRHLPPLPYTTSLPAALTLVNESVQWWDLGRRKNDPGLGKPGHNERLYIAHVGAHTSKAKRAAIGTGESDCRAHALTIAALEAMTS